MTEIKEALLAFSSRIPMARRLTSRPFIPLEFIFVYGVKKVTEVHSSACRCPVFLTPFAEETVFIPWDILSCFAKDYGHALVGLFLGSLRFSIDLCVFFLWQYHTVSMITAF